MIKLDKDRLIKICDRSIEVAFYVLFFCLPFSIALIEISASVIILAWILKRIFSPRVIKANFIGQIKKFNPVPSYLNIPILVFILANLFSVIFSSNFALSLRNFGSKTMEYILLYFIAVEFLRDKRILKNAIIALLVSALMISLDCVFQYFFGFDLLRNRSLEAHRVTASFVMPGDLAGYLGVILCLILSLSFLKIRTGWRIFLRAESIFLLLLLMATLARGAWLGFIIGLCFLTMLENRKILYITVIFFFILSLAMRYFIKTPHDVFSHLRSMIELGDFSSLDRKAVWTAALAMIQDRPLFGHGLSTFMGNFAAYAQDYPLLKYGIIPYAHNCYLQIAAETGLVGLVSFLLLIWTFLIHTIGSLFRIKNKFEHTVLSGVSAGIIVTLVHSFVDTNLYSLQLSVLFWLMLAVNSALQGNVVFRKAGI
ncbi:O-antigen ligase family protein [Candidatus Omnitrophota bacterium]